MYDQLLRCPNHKKFEANLLMEMPKNTSFLDVGAHFGDTTLTMALHAKNNNREDIRFFAFEPNKEKCEHIKNIRDLNELNITIFNNCVGGENSFASPDGVLSIYSGGCSYVLNDVGDIKIIKLDDVAELITPIGIMHVDTEGWETFVLQGAHDILSNPENKMYLILECWDDHVASRVISSGRAKGVASCTPERDIVNHMKNTIVLE